ncbi:MAG TPA: DUF6519 domain-containing protein [Trebonia sp.]|nr:DUF6519 domain-containing protein [Trebonia sp.]
MSSDRARVTYDPSRRYHGVVAQQGRVSLEADWNEEQAIAGAEFAGRTLDVVGRAGSPDRGYEVSPVTDGGTATGDLLFRAGTLYVGGQRVHNTRDVRYGDQAEWADHEGDPLWRAPAVPQDPHELVCLLASEQEVSAAEDPALRDVALGGPDTTQRLRLLPRVVRHPTTAQTWEDAWGQLIEEQWLPRGFVMDEASRALLPGARLLVTAYSPGGAEQPADHGGYLGPNNQLIRVRIARVDDDGVPVLVWGYDNASFLYRLSSSVTSASHTILRLATAPVDAYHQPREHQVVEVLRSAAVLTADACVAAAVGQVTRVAVAYDPDSREVVAGAELPPEYLKKPGEGLPLFLRVWEGELRCTPGKEHELGGTGLRVRLTGLPAPAAPGEGAEAPPREKYPVGAYWMIAVRPGVGPGAEGVVYPQRILGEPQPPDGPRQWLTPLAFVRWQPAAPRPPEPEDCVPRFSGLARAERSARSCTVHLQPHEVGGGRGLQDVIDAHASRDRAATICLAPGTYALPRPLRIGPEHGRLTIKATAPGVVLRAEPEAADRFLLGMIIAAEADGLCLDGIEFRPAHSRFTVERDIYLNLPERARVLLDSHRERIVSVGVRAARCTRLSVERCHFVFSFPEPGEPRHHADLFGAAIFSVEELRGLRVTGCTFAGGEQVSHAHRRPRSGEAAEGRHHVVIGMVHVPHAVLSIPPLTDAVFEGNTFERLTAPLLAIGQLGDIRVERNTVRAAHAGFWLVTQHASHVLTLLDRMVNLAEEAFRDLVAAQLGVLAEPLLLHATALARALPLAPPDDGSVPQPRQLEPPSATEERDASELLHQLSAPDAPEEQRPPAPAQRENRLRRFLDTFGQARTTRAQPQEAVVPAAAVLRCVLGITGNVVDCGDAPGLVVLDTARDGASLVLAGNQLRGRPRPGAVACLYRLRSCAVAANVISNETDDGDEDWDEPSLVVLARRHHGRHETAVTGNVLVGRTHLPRRPDEFPGWASLNSLTRW